MIHGETVSIEQSTTEQLPASDLTEQEHQVLVLASHGGTTEQVASLLSVDEGEISKTRDSILQKLGTVTMAQAINDSIQSGRLAIETKNAPISKRHNFFKPRESLALRMIAAGFVNREISAQLGKSYAAYDSNIAKKLFRKINSNGRTHSVRRAYELRIFKILEIP